MADFLDEEIETTLAEHLRGKEMLILLDNFEQVLDAAVGIAVLLRQTEKLKLVITSRARLQLTGEREYPVPSLSETEAVALFAERAQAAKPSFVLNGNRPLVAEICARLDRLPLAIELAAARVKLLPENALLQRLDERLKLLTGGARDLDEQQRTLRATIDWSYNLLDEQEQRLFRRLAVFAGGRTLEAIEAICDVEGDLGIAVLGGVESLLETIHEYARELLRETGEAAEIRVRHARFYRDLVAAEESHDHTYGWVRQFEPELPNLRLALAEFAQRGDAESEVGLAAMLGPLWYSRGLLAEEHAHLEQALAHGSRVSDGARVRALEQLSMVAFRQGRFGDALASAEEAVAVARRCDDPRLLCQALDASGLAASGVGDFTLARTRFEEGLAVARAAGDDTRAAHTISNLADLALTLGDYEEARRRSTEALAVFRALGANVSITFPLFNLASAEFHLGAIEDALAHALEVLVVCRGTSRETIVVSLELVAAIATRRRATAAAVRLLGAADKLLSDVGQALGPAEAQLHEKAVEAARVELTEDEFSRAWTEGAAMSEDQAVDYALSALPPAVTVGGEGAASETP